MDRSGGRVVFVALLLLFSLSAYIAQGRTSEPPAVISAVAPVYPAIAQSVNASGDVVVTVEINRSGDVISARVDNGHALLLKASVDASPLEVRDEHRRIPTAQLIFTFRIVPDKTAGIDRTPVFYPPYRIEVRSEHLIVTTNYQR